MSSTPVTKPQQPDGALAGNLTHTTQRFAPVIAAALRDLSAGGDLEVPDPDLAVIQFYALTVYPHHPVHVRDQPRPARYPGPAGQRGRYVRQLLPGKRPCAASEHRAAPRQPGKPGDTMSHPTDPRVDAYIDALPGWHLPPGPRLGARRP